MTIKWIYTIKTQNCMVHLQLAIKEISQLIRSNTQQIPDKALKNSRYNFINSTFDQTINVQITSPKLKNEKLAKISPNHWTSELQAKVITKELPFPNSKWKLLQYFPPIAPRGENQ